MITTAPIATAAMHAATIQPTTGNESLESKDVDGTSAGGGSEDGWVRSSAAGGGWEDGWVRSSAAGGGETGHGCVLQARDCVNSFGIVQNAGSIPSSPAPLAQHS